MTTPILMEQKAAPKPTKPAAPSIYQSGFCTIGSHENTVKLSPSGKQLKSCPVGGRFDMGVQYRRAIDEDTLCTCPCHDTSRQMEELSGIKFPAHSVQREGSALSGMGLLQPPRVGTDGAKAPVDGDVNRPTVAAPSGRLFTATPSGRAARGQLEESVRHFVNQQVRAAGDEMIAILGLTPDFLGSLIDPVNPPSSGAIYSVFIRWEKQNFVELSKSPFRFIRYTDRGKRELFR